MSDVRTLEAHLQRCIKKIYWYYFTSPWSAKNSKWCRTCEKLQLPESKLETLFGKGVLDYKIEVYTKDVTAAGAEKKTVAKKKKAPLLKVVHVQKGT